MLPRAARITAAVGVAMIAAAPDLPVRAAQGGSPALLSQLVWFDRAGKRLETIGPVDNHGNIELSPDGERVAVAVLNTSEGTRDIWLYDAARGGRTRFTATDADENWAIWSRDGRRLVFNSTRNGRLDLFQGGLAPGSVPEMLLVDGMWPLSWAPDGRHILFVTNSAATSNDVMVLPLFGDRRPFPFARTRTAENWAAFSPNGRWVAFSSAESGQAEVYVAPFPPSPAGATGKRQVSVDGGSQARWSRDGRELFFIGANRSLMVAEVRGDGASFEVGSVRRLFEPRFFFLDSHGFDVALDGQRILVNTLVVSPRAPTSVARN